jgi:hypothetical protein
MLKNIKIAKNHTCIIHSNHSLIAFFQNIFKINPFIIININLPQSRAGIGNKLNTPKFMLIIAQIIKIKTIPFQIDFIIKSTTQIGHETCLIASCLSVGV